MKRYALRSGAVKGECGVISSACFARPTHASEMGRRPGKLFSFRWERQLQGGYEFTNRAHATIRPGRQASRLVDTVSSQISGCK